MSNMINATTPTLPTNTLTITNLPTDLFEAAPIARLRAQVAALGQVHFFSPIKSFHRVFVVYESVIDAQRAKSLLHNTAFEGTTIRVYYGQHTELTIDPAKYYLHLPQLSEQSPQDESQTYVSPPGSPPLSHTEADDDMEILMLEDEQEAQVEEPVAVESLPSIQEPAPTPSQGRLEQRIRGLRIDTDLSPMTQSKSPMSTTRRFPLSPISPSGSSSNLLLPSTPTMLAFSPSKESVGEQPFITIQDWGMEDNLSVSCH
ncbi:hypothetical protein BGZ81_000680 [Podila clonocystis]|nr:hypothetical protein BGZ81_000680 [Podila clonocystis]